MGPLASDGARGPVLITVGAQVQAPTVDENEPDVNEPGPCIVRPGHDLPSTPGAGALNDISRPGKVGGRKERTGSTRAPPAPQKVAA